MFKKALAVTAIACASLGASVGNAANIDLAFIMDRSGSVGSNFSTAMNALGDALSSALGPAIGNGDTYTVAVVTFSDSATVKVTPTVIDSLATLATVVSQIKTGNGNGSGLTNYTAAFNTLGTAFSSRTLGDLSLINMMTDGQPTTGGSGSDGHYNTSLLQGAGWDSLSFESIGNTSGNNLLADICFGPGNAPGDATKCPIYTSAASITNPATAPFVLDLPSFSAYNNVIGSKVQKIVTPTVPVPASLPLLAGGVALFGFIGRRRRNKAA